MPGRVPGPARVPGRALVPAQARGPARVPVQARERERPLEAQERTCSEQAELATPYTVPAGNLWRAPDRRPQRTR
ncbi:hypothetical protein GCM10009589_18820 [Arthrobacter pascens]